MLSRPKNGQKEGTSLSYKKWLSLKKYRPRTVMTYLSNRDHIERYLLKESLFLSKESLQSYANWVLAQGYSNAYEQQLYKGLRSYYSYLKVYDWFNGSLVLPKLKSDYVRRTALSSRELSQLKSWLSENTSELRAVLWLLFYGCGLRRREVENLSLLSIYYRSSYLEVRSLKNDKLRQIPLSKGQLSILRSYINSSRPVAQTGFGSRLILGPRGGSCGSLLGRELSLWQIGSGLGSRFCWHVLRHSIASELVQKGIEIRLVAQFLGHRSLSATHHYLHNSQ